MGESTLRGVIPVVYSPFAEDGSVDYMSLESLCGWLLESGVDGLAMFGLASEYYKLTDDERRWMTRVVVEACEEADRPSVINVTDHSTDVAVRRAREAEAAGASALMVLPPFFLSPSATDIYDHVARIGRAVSIPVVVQYTPERTGVAIPPRTLARLAEEVPTIRYFKIENTPPGPYISHLLAESEQCEVLVGSAGYHLIDALDRGAVGVMPGAAFPEVYLEMVDAYDEGDRERAMEIHADLLPLLNHTTQSLELALAYGKRILVRRGVIESDYRRAPTAAPDDRHDEQFEAHYDRIVPYLDRR